jgi:hypothetical protein
MMKADFDAQRHLLRRDRRQRGAGVLLLEVNDNRIDNGALTCPRHPEAQPGGRAHPGQAQQDAAHRVLDLRAGGRHLHRQEQLVHPQARQGVAARLRLRLDDELTQ